MAHCCTRIPLEVFGEILIGGTDFNAWREIIELVKRFPAKRDAIRVNRAPSPLFDEKQRDACLARLAAKLEAKVSAEFSTFFGFGFFEIRFQIR